MPLLPVNQPLIMRVRKRGQALGRGFRPYPPQGEVLFGQIKVGIDGSYAGFRHGSTGPSNAQINFGDTGGWASRWVGRVSVTTGTDLVVISSYGPIMRDIFGSSVNLNMSADGGPVGTLAWDGPSTRYQGTIAGAGAWFGGQAGNWVEYTVV